MFTQSKNKLESFMSVCDKSHAPDSYKRHFAYCLTVMITYIIAVFMGYSLYNGETEMIGVQVLLITINIACIVAKKLYDVTAPMVWNINGTYTIFLLFMIFNGGTYDSTSFMLWFVIYPIIATSINGMYRGMLLIGIYGIAAAMTVIFNHHSMLPVAYDVNLLKNFVMGFLFMSYMALSLEYFRAKTVLDMESTKNKFKRISNTDALTGLYNRRLAQQTIVKSCHSKSNFCILFIDLDHFKPINDTYGHEVGDDVLKEVSKCLTDNIRESGGDLVSRWGGEEFLVFLNDIPQNAAINVAERMRESIEQLKYTTPNGTSLSITASFGVSCSKGGVATAKEIIAKDDNSLYESKSNGRNRVTFGGCF